MEEFGRQYGVKWPGEELIHNDEQLDQLDQTCRDFERGFHSDGTSKRFLCPTYILDNKFHGVKNDDWWAVANQESAMQFLTLRLPRITSVKPSTWWLLQPAQRLDELMKEFVNLAYDTLEKQMGCLPRTVVDIGCGTGTFSGNGTNVHAAHWGIVSSLWR